MLVMNGIAKAKLMRATTPQNQLNAGMENLKILANEQRLYLNNHRSTSLKIRLQSLAIEDHGAACKQADISKALQWLDRANNSIPRLYDRRQSRPEGSPSYKARC
ncbi:hypothetical protein GCM10007363_30880 [Pseudomonas fluvialis]|uniref:Uncharacterized protein n=1 Tax=Pseudomonas fluvialis TaxID=1793966 RepID=A0ABQ2AUB7_9PSED|nr:hypothetical protein GCM10007363_30880 [Pseudomonas fluvialis]